jgi:hypothetical protein
MMLESTRRLCRSRSNYTQQKMPYCNPKPSCEPNPKPSVQFSISSCLMDPRSGTMLRRSRMLVLKMGDHGLRML